jgi:hypothetical protein
MTTTILSTNINHKFPDLIHCMLAIVRRQRAVGQLGSTSVSVHMPVHVCVCVCRLFLKLRIPL